MKVIVTEIRVGINRPEMFSLKYSGQYKKHEGQVNINTMFNVILLQKIQIEK